MVFSSVTFLFYFLPLFLLVFYATRCSKWALAAFSIVFYAWGEPIFVVLLFASIAANYVLGLKIEQARASGRAGPGSPPASSSTWSRCCCSSTAAS